MRSVRFTRSVAGRLKHLVSRAINVWRPGYHTVPSYYGASHWKLPHLRTLPGFGPIATASIGSGRSLLNYDRLYVIYQALTGVAQRFHGEVINSAEVGVYRGGTSHFIAAVRRDLGLSGQHFALDTFEGHPGEDVRATLDHKQYPGSFSDTSHDDVAELLAPFQFVSIRKGRIQDTAASMDGHRFHFVHLDVDIFEPTIFSLRWFGQRLEIGGVIVVDDYGVTTCPGVVRAVEESLGDQKFFALAPLTAQMVLVKLGE